MDRLIDAAAQAHGIGTLRCFADYFRTPQKAAAAAVRNLVDAGRLQPVTVAGWDRPLYRHAEAKLPRAATGRALLSPFDSLVFERRRLEELFGFHYRIEIYTPEPKRQYRLLRPAVPAARRDRRAGRPQSRPGRRPAPGAGRARRSPARRRDTAVELAAELQLMAEWLGLDEVVVIPGGGPCAGARRSRGSPG